MCLLLSNIILQVVRKERAVGVLPLAPTVYEVLEEIVFTVQAQLIETPLPFCAFNGGADVFVDVGNKSLGLEALMNYLNLRPPQVNCLLQGQIIQKNVMPWPIILESNQESARYQEL